MACRGFLNYLKLICFAGIFLDYKFYSFLIFFCECKGGTIMLKLVVIFKSENIR